MHNVSCIAKIWLTLMAMLFRQAKQKSHLGNEPHFINFTLHASSSQLKREELWCWKEKCSSSGFKADVTEKIDIPLEKVT